PWPLHLESIDSNEAEFFRLGWIADYPDAENFLALFMSRNHTPGPNATLYENEEFDRLYDEAMLEPDEAKRAVVYERAAGIVIDECPWLFTTTGETISLRQPWIKDYPVNPLAVYYYKNLVIERRETEVRSQ
ncbi:MAG TPA: ABC transporter substrate-binding protein, partial [Armatimonadota bacterium]|nr:ABC transporter substrate-binding protein [Armatimonadota bacterium]